MTAPLSRSSPFSAFPWVRLAFPRLSLQPMGVRWRRERLPVRCGPGETEKSLREMARRMLSCYLARHEPAGRVLAVEEPFRLDLSPRIAPVHGRIDLAEAAPDGQIVVTDFKSAGTRKAPDPAQLVLYREAVRSFSADPDVQVSARFVVLLKAREPDVVVHEPEIGPADLQSLTGRYEEVWQPIQSGCSFPVTGWWCGGCQWAGHCNAS